MPNANVTLQRMPLSILITQLEIGTKQNEKQNENEFPKLCNIVADIRSKNIRPKGNRLKDILPLS